MEKGGESKPKLRSYITFKKALVLESYLQSEYDRRGRVIMTAIRTGSNKLRIETGRWKRPQEQVTDRICMACIGGHIEDERHFISRV